MTHAHTRLLAGAGCALALAGCLGVFALNAGTVPDANAEQATASADAAATNASADETTAEDATAENPYLNVTDKLYGDEATAEALIASGATFSDLKDAGIEVLLDEGGKLLFDPHAGHYDFACTDCHRGAAEAGDSSSDAGATTDGTSDNAVAPVLMCNTCHRLTLPDGWENPEYDQSTKPLFVDPLTIYGDLGYGTSGVSYGIPYSNTDK